MLSGGEAIVLFSGAGSAGVVLSPGIGNGFGCGGSALSLNGERSPSSIFDLLLFVFAAGNCADRMPSAESSSRFTTTLRPTGSLSRPLVNRGASLASQAVSLICVRLKTTC